VIDMLDISHIRPLKGKVLVHNIESGARLTRGGIILPDDNGKESGIRDRWCQVYAVGPDINDVQVGDWVLVKHGRWSRGIDINDSNGKTTIRQIDWPEAVLLVSDTNLAENSH
jgi:co-chaperonin GroES (HSP10)